MRGRGERGEGRGERGEERRGEEREGVYLGIGFCFSGGGGCSVLLFMVFARNVGYMI